MILGDPNAPYIVQGGRATLDDIFRGVAARDPDRTALIDPPNRSSFTDGAPRRLTYREADRVTGAIADRLRRLGLPTDTVVGLQLPNTIEGVLTVLGVLRAGMIAALLKARSRDDFVTAVRALDRALVSGCYVVPLFHLPEQWVARWAHVRHPATTSLFGYLPETWWRRAS